MAPIIYTITDEAPRLATYSLLTARNLVLVATIVVGFVTIERAARRDAPEDQSTLAGSDGAPLISSIRSSATRADAAVRSSTTI